MGGHGRAAWALLVLTTLLAASCGGTTGAAAPGNTTATRAPATTARSHRAARPPHRHHHRRRRPRTGPQGLIYATAAADVVQPQPPAGSCHSRGSGLFVLPDPGCTPGALDPAVTQADIGSTICADGWTATIRPPEAITEPEKQASMGAYGLGGYLGGYEYDHLVPLELGGAPNSPRNLWPEPDYPNPSGYDLNPKDRVEYALNGEVCDGRISLAVAQREIATDWVAAYRREFGTPAVSGGSGGSCTVTASYNSSYGDWDVYVHSNQPDATATVTDSGGASASWHTDGSGYADVYLHASRFAAGERLTARVGSAECTTTM